MVHPSSSPKLDFRDGMKGGFPMLYSSSECAVTKLAILFKLCTRCLPRFLVELSSCLGLGIAKTAIIFKSWRFKEGLSAKEIVKRDRCLS